MLDVPELIDGYRRFVENRYPQEAATYRTLASQGQTPRNMVIACCDSRVDPATIFSAEPGQLFVVRNVANLVPPFEPYGDYHGTSAALEFAVTGLEVKTIVVMGHASCGGVRAYLDNLFGPVQKSDFIARWMSLLNGARTRALRAATDGEIENQQRAMEHASIQQSLENLMTFPFIKDRVNSRGLKLRGCYFSIADGILLALDPKTDKFSPVG